MKMTKDALNEKVRLLNIIDNQYIYALHYAYGLVSLRRGSTVLLGFSTKKELSSLIDAYYKGILNERERITKALL